MSAYSFKGFSACSFCVWKGINKKEYKKGRTKNRNQYCLIVHDELNPGPATYMASFCDF